MRKNVFLKFLSFSFLIFLIFIFASCEDEKINDNNELVMYSVEHYQQNIDNDDFELYERELLEGKNGELTKIISKDYEGFTSPLFEQVKIKKDGSNTIVLNYSRNSYNVFLSKNINNAGEIYGAGLYKYDKSILIEATKNPGYTFTGWYRNNELYSKQKSFNYKINSFDVSFEARYTINKYKILIENQTDGLKVSGVVSGNEYDYNEHMIITTNVQSDKYLLWYFDDEIRHLGSSFEFDMPSHNVRIKLVLLDKSISNEIYKKEENTVYFGNYPQTLVTDERINYVLNKLSGPLPTQTNSYNWIEYNYYINGEITSFMYYQDIDFNGNGVIDYGDYRGVYFTQYRPYNCFDCSYDNGDVAYQDDNGYYVDRVYWFSFEPIEWIARTSSEYNGKTRLVSKMILDYQEFYPSKSSKMFEHNGGIGYANNYELSNIRRWLNKDFYNISFNELQKQMINESLIDNSPKSMYYLNDQIEEGASVFACNDTKDKIFLLSYREIAGGKVNRTTSDPKATDYAKCQGIDVSKRTTDLGTSSWITRSPYYDSSRSSDLGYFADRICCVDSSLKPYTSGNGGIRPACYIQL